VTVWIGTSGWQYRDWRGLFYPADQPQKGWLEHYAERFRTVELNNSFYRLPTRDAFVQWAERTPADFVVAVKASQYLSHMKRLRDPAEPVARLMERAGGLGPKLGPVLLQLPERFELDAARLGGALAEFPAGVRVAVELRHRSWFVEEIRELLSAHGAALVLADRGARWLTPRWRTAGWGYVRFHGGTARPWSCYSPQSLTARARDVAAGWSDDEDLFVYFNNDPNGCAVRDAGVFAGVLRRRGRTVTRVPPRAEAPVAGG